MNKKKPSSLELNELNTLTETVAEHPIFQWIMKNSSNIAFGAMLAAALLFFGYRTSANNNSQAEIDYFNAQNDYQIFAGQNERPATAEGRDEALQDLKAILAKRPELKTKYEALIAQELLIQGKASEAQDHMNRVFKRTAADNLPLYTAFSKISLLIGQAEYATALEESKALEQKIAGETSGHDASLRIYNLLRIAILEQQLGNREGELEAWKNFKAYALNTETATSHGQQTASLLMQNLFAEGNASITSYIEAREAKLQ